MPLHSVDSSANIVPGQIAPYVAMLDVWCKENPEMAKTIHVFGTVSYSTRDMLQNHTWGKSKKSNPKNNSQCTTCTMRSVCKCEIADVLPVGNDMEVQQNSSSIFVDFQSFTDVRLNVYPKTAFEQVLFEQKYLLG